MDLNSAVTFWVILVGLNTIFFLPRWILDFSSTEFFPVSGLFRGTFKQRVSWLFIRRNYDLFKINTDFVILSLLYVVIIQRTGAQPGLTISLWLFFGVSFIYNLYFTVFHKIYKIEPVLFNDLFVLKTAGQIFIHDFKFKNLLFTILAIGLIPLSYLAVSALVAYAPVVSNVLSVWVVTGVLVVCSVFSVVNYGYAQMPMCTFQSPVISFFQNIRRSIESRKELKSLTLARMTEFNINRDIKLVNPPNVYLVMVESYGRVVMDDDELRPAYEQNLTRLEALLGEAGWSASSALTVSPVTGGASWLSYTSVLYGLRVAAQSVFLTLLKNEYIEQYDNLFQWLRRQSYKTFRLSSLGGYENMEIPYDRYSRMYAVDEWIKYKDLGYEGFEYGFGPCPPDQYSLGFANEKIREQTDGPFALFFITQNSHTPYDSPYEVAEDWRELSNPESRTEKQSQFWSRPKFEKYGRAINYQLDFLADFILKEGGENDLFVLIGDHQPPSLKKDIRNFETPLHILSKNRTLVDFLHAEGLSSGLHPGRANQAFRQEGLRTLVLRALIHTYGRGETPLPEHLPNGIPYQ